MSSMTVLSVWPVQWSFRDKVIALWFLRPCHASEAQPTDQDAFLHKTSGHHAHQWGGGLQLGCSSVGSALLHQLSTLVASLNKLCLCIKHLELKLSLVVLSFYLPIYSVTMMDQWVFFSQNQKTKPLNTFFHYPQTTFFICPCSLSPQKSHQPYQSFHKEQTASGWKAIVKPRWVRTAYVHIKCLGNRVVGIPETYICSECNRLSPEQ